MKRLHLLLLCISIYVSISFPSRGVTSPTNTSTDLSNLPQIYDGNIRFSLNLNFVWLHVFAALSFEASLAFNQCIFPILCFWMLQHKSPILIPPWQCLPWCFFKLCFIWNNEWPGSWGPLFLLELLLVLLCLACLLSFLTILHADVVTLWKNSFDICVYRSERKAYKFVGITCSHFRRPVLQ